MSRDRTFGRRSDHRATDAELWRFRRKLPHWFIFALYAAAMGAVWILGDLLVNYKQDPTPIEASFDGIPNVRITYYDVVGKDSSSIRADLNRKRPVDAASGGIGVDAFTSWHYRWHWDATTSGQCGTPSARIDFSAHVLLPRLSQELLSRDVKDEWARYITALANHEADHVRIAYRRLNQVVEAVRGSNCNDASAAANKVLDDIRRDNREYDIETSHGINQGAKFPS